MAGEKKTPEAEKPAPSLDELVKQLQSIGDYEKRKAFYFANPQLATVINPNNFSA